MKKLVVSLGLLGSLLFSATPNMVDASNLCYKNRTYPINYNLLFDAMKKRVLDSNMHLKHLSKKDGFIEAEGVKSYDDEIYRFTFTINFRKLGDVNQISTLVSYEKMEKESQVHSITQFNLPIPIPWSKAFKYEGYTNVIDPEFFDTFYLNFDKTLFDMQMKSMKVEIVKTKDKQLLKDLGEKEDLNVTKNIVKDVIKQVEELNSTKKEDSNVTKKIIKETSTKMMDLNVSKKVVKNVVKQVKELNTTKKVIKKSLKTVKESNSPKNKGNK